MDQNTGKVLFEKNSHEVRSSASLMKIMNMLLVIEALEDGSISEDENVVVSDNAAAVKGVNVWLKSGEILTVSDLMKAMAMISANDAAMAVAEHMEKSEGKFTAKMNQKAAELQLKNTIFKDCIGSDEDGNVTSAYDIAMMARELMKHSEILQYTSTWIDHIRNGQTQIVNKNRLLKTYSGVTGLATGTTEKAGSCIVATAEKNGMKLIGVLLGCKDPKERSKEIANLLDYGFSEYITVTPEIPKDLPKFLKIKNGMLSEVEISAPLTKSMLISKHSAKNISSQVKINLELTAPVVLNQKVGEIIYTQGNEPLYTCDIIINSRVDEITFGAVLKNLVVNFFKL